MNNPVSAASPVDEWTNPRGIDGIRALQTGLELARASHLTMLRLQLALHKSNSRTAMQALDHLLDIDAEMEDLTATLRGGSAYPASDAALSGFIGLQRAAIAAEKHALTGGDWRTAAEPIAIAALDCADAAGHPARGDQAASDNPLGNERWRPALAAAILLIVIGLALIACLLPTLPATLASHLDFR